MQHKREYAFDSSSNVQTHNRFNEESGDEIGIYNEMGILPRFGSELSLEINKLLPKQSIEPGELWQVKGSPLYSVSRTLSLSRENRITPKYLYFACYFIPSTSFSLKRPRSNAD